MDDKKANQVLRYGPAHLHLFPGCWDPGMPWYFPVNLALHCCFLSLSLGNDLSKVVQNNGKESFTYPFPSVTASFLSYYLSFTHSASKGDFLLLLDSEIPETPPPLTYIALPGLASVGDFTLVFQSEKPLIFNFVNIKARGKIICNAMPNLFSI